MRFIFVELNHNWKDDNYEGNRKNLQALRHEYYNVEILKLESRSN